jgi:hypothetical protein
VDLPATPESLLYLQFYLRTKDGKKEEESEGRIYLIEREEPVQGAPSFQSVDAEHLPGPGGRLTRQGPSYFSSREGLKQNGWMRVRFAFRTMHNTQSLRLMVGAIHFQGHLLLDDLTLRELPE